MGGGCVIRALITEYQLGGHISSGSSGSHQFVLSF